MASTVHEFSTHQVCYSISSERSPNFLIEIERTIFRCQRNCYWAPSACATQDSVQPLTTAEWEVHFQGTWAQGKTRVRSIPRMLWVPCGSSRYVQCIFRVLRSYWVIKEKTSNIQRDQMTNKSPQIIFDAKMQLNQRSKRPHDSCASSNYGCFMRLIQLLQQLNVLSATLAILFLPVIRNSTFVSDLFSTFVSETILRPSISLIRLIQHQDGNVS